jgi:cellulose biosynthesis protein BcsQ
MSATRVIVVANEKGGSGKSTVAMHVAVALMKAGQRVATIDLDTQVTARLEIQNLLSALLLGGSRANAELAGRDRRAA